MIGFELITLFPELFETLHRAGITARAYQEKHWSYRTWNPRDYADNRRGNIDDRPFGGGPGMIMQVAPLDRTLHAVKKQLAVEGKFHTPATTEPQKIHNHTRFIHLSPQGKTLNHAQVLDFANAQHLVLLCGRYEGIDERLFALHDFEHCSIGDYVVTGGELPAMVLMDAIIRQQTGVLGNAQSLTEESFVTANALEYPQYSRPENYQGLQVPKVLLSGDHQAIRLWREQQTKKRSSERSVPLQSKQ